VGQMARGLLKKSEQQLFSNDPGNKLVTTLVFFFEGYPVIYPYLSDKITAPGQGYK